MRDPPANNSGDACAKNCSLFIIDEESPWIGQYLSEAFRGFPNDILESVIPQRRGGYGSTILPHSARSHRVSYGKHYIRAHWGSCFLTQSDFNCVINHPALTQDSAVSNVKGHLLGVHFTPIGTWVCPPSVLHEETRQSDIEPQEFHEQQIIALFSSSHIVKNKLDTHFNATRFAYRKDRLNDNPWWIFIDLLYLFSDWRDIWEAARSDLVVRDAETHNDIKAPPLLQLTRQLHRDTANVIALREHLRLHVSAVQNYSRLVVNRKGAGETHEQLMERTEDLLEDLKNHQETSQVILHQLENLVSLSFNIQSVSHSQVVSRLNLLLLLFLPLIFVAVRPLSLPFIHEDFSDCDLGNVWYDYMDHKGRVVPFVGRSCRSGCHGCFLWNQKVDRAKALNDTTTARTTAGFRIKISLFTFLRETARSYAASGTRCWHWRYLFKVSERCRYWHAIKNQPTSQRPYSTSRSDY
jgi:hypothetical protein